MKKKKEKWKKNEKNDRKWKKMKENERKWKKMKENEKFFKKEKNEKIEKWKKNEKMKKWKKFKKKEKMKKWKKWKKKKKTKKKWRKMMKKERKMEKLDSHAKSSTISRIYRCCCNFFRQNPRRFPWFFSECVSFPREINNPFWVVIVFPKKSDNFHWTWNKNTHFTDENERKKNR